MNYPWLDEYCLSKKGAEKDFKIEWNATRYLIGGKMFGMQGGDKVGKAIITLKCDPFLGENLRREYPDVVPGYYMNKVHWNSLYLDGNVPDDVLKQMIDNSYELVLKGLSKEARKRILDGDAY